MKKIFIIFNGGAQPGQMAELLSYEQHAEIIAETLEQIHSNRFHGQVLFHLKWRAIEWSYSMCYNYPTRIWAYYRRVTQTKLLDAYRSDMYAEHKETIQEMLSNLSEGSE